MDRRYDVIVFLGPTLRLDEARAELDARYLPPAAQGDVYRASLSRPLAIAVIDGYFERVPSVWHKEILYSMSEGIHVFGGASMGALRAAELAAFGMRGVGAVYEAYRDGTLEDDDEVAVTHAPAELGFTPLSEPMVDMRRTVADAVAAGVITPGSAVTLVTLAKELFYPRRSYDHVISLAERAGVSPEEIARFRGWLPTGRVSQKGEDALLTLRTIRQWLASNPARNEVRYMFNHTGNWELLRRENRVPVTTRGAMPEADSLNPLLEEVRLRGEPTFSEVRSGGLLRYLCLEDANRHQVLVTPEFRARVLGDFCRERGLTTEEDVDAWCAENGLPRDQFAAFIDEECKLRWVDSTTQLHASSHILNYFRSRDRCRGILRRLEQKEKILGGREPGPRRGHAGERGPIAVVFHRPPPKERAGAPGRLLHAPRL